MATLGGLAHHREGRVLVGFETGQRISEKSDFHGWFQWMNNWILAGNPQARAAPARPRELAPRGCRA
jgi:hypothetical protein